jgi:hypothetical protein
MLACSLLSFIQLILLKLIKQNHKNKITYLIIKLLNY